MRVTLTTPEIMVLMEALMKALEVEDSPDIVMQYISLRKKLRKYTEPVG